MKEPTDIETLQRHRQMLLAKAKKIVKWLRKLEAQAQKEAAGSNFVTHKEACESDAKNYRATAADVQVVIDHCED